MTSDCDLLRRYAETNSEEAFAELVRRHLDLVYSAALRQVNGDAHLAQDVTQSVFTDLARKAESLSRRLVLTGWLYTSAHFAAAKAVRAERRRRAHEQEAQTMRELHDPTPDLDWSKLRPVLDEAMHQLKEADREAILLRYFEQRQLAEIGARLGVSENTARMRVERALDKLRAHLARRGISTSASVLSAAISVSAVQSAPAGLAATLTSASLAGAAAETGISATLMKLMATTKLKAGIMSAFVIAGVMTSLVIDRQARAGLREQEESWRQQAHQRAQLAADNERLSNLAAQINGSAANGQLDELLKLRAEAERLRSQTKKLDALREGNGRLQELPSPQPQTPLQVAEMVRAKQECVEAWMRAFIACARENRGQLPASFEQAEPFWPKEIRKRTDVAADQFEILYAGSLDALTNQRVIVFREKKPWPHLTGKWGRFYGMASGGGQYCSSSDKTANGNFDAFEREAAAPTTRQ
jgi:RNA polymerase sigma factor (sigma-70 family)